MSATLQSLVDVGLNGFGAQLLAESLLKSAIADDGKPIRFLLPITRGDCPGWAGVEFSITPITVDSWNARAASDQANSAANREPKEQEP